jgi:rhodanese-related sulfurtransferase
MSRVADDEEIVGRWQRIQRPWGLGRWLLIAAVVVVVPVLVLAAILFGAGRSLALEAVQRLAARKFPTLEWVEPEELAQWRADSSRPQPVLLDARTPPEYNVSHLKGAVRVDARAPSLRAIAAVPRDTPVVVYCTVGYRSARVAQWLRRQGFHTVYDLAGGLFGWANEGRPMEANGRPVLQVHPYNELWGRLLEPKARADRPPITDPLSLP